MNLRRLWITTFSLLSGLAAVTALLYGGQRLWPPPAGVEPASVSAGQSIAILAVFPPTDPLEVGAIFTVTIAAGQIESPLSAFQIDLAYNPAVLAFRFSQSRSFLTTTSRQIVCPEPAGVAGTIRLACATTGAAGGPTGDGPLAVLTFAAIANGTSDLTLNNIQLLDTGRPPALLPADLQQGQVIVGPPVTGTPTDTPPATNTPTSTVTSTVPGQTATATPTETATSAPTPSGTPAATATPTPQPAPVDWYIYLPLIVR
jgi:cell division septation protein DedD